MQLLLPIAYITLACSQHALAWGTLGHQTVGYVAQEFLAPNALAFVQSSLGSTYSGSLGPAAPWADTVRDESGYTWSAPLHYVDAEDSPLSDSCSVQEQRDCGSGRCILTAIANYTTRVATTSLSATQRQEALKFLGKQHSIPNGKWLTGFAYEVGGNDISAKCSGKSTNLHAVSDSRYAPFTGVNDALNQAWGTTLGLNIDDNHGGAVKTYAADLIARIKNGSYKSLTGDWLSCTSTTEPVSKRTDGTAHGVEEDVKRLLARTEDAAEATITPLECPLVWAREANAYCCSVVFTYTTGEDLCTSDYYTNAVPVIDLQLATQGYRLAAWLNVIFDGSTNLP
ncbi:hypothetical protein BN946_scf184650.g4 [Trametes cinnabarina]|uniref:Nuclease Le1 n=1 Tax=Pycnoporus cinnabarinus TaxID=5643 RepID=A0A060S743_PYCCI|nr:hypothetical protein BN946_scf184650.g4 [Trametes cinnabarina]